MQKTSTSSIGRKRPGCGIISRRSLADSVDPKLLALDHSPAVKTMPVGVAYALWSGLGIVLITTAGAVLYKQVPNLAAAAGILLIIAGVVVINLFSRTVVR